MSAAAAATTRTQTLIVGAGIAGLTTALRILTQYPREQVIVLEKYHVVGGRALTYHKDLSNTRVQWEAGAGRIHASHTRLHSLIAKYKLHTYPISPDAQFLLEGGATPERDNFEELLPTLLLPFENLPAETLASSTLWQLACKLYGRRAAAAYFARFPYYTEVHCLRADLALETFKQEMGTRANYTVLKEGFSALVEALAADVVKRGGVILTRHSLENYTESSSPNGTFIHATVKVSHGKDAHVPPVFQTFVADRIILALHAEALRPLKALRKWKPLSLLASAKLLRIYAVFPKDPRTGRPWCADLTRTITPGSLRYIIPVDPARGVIMISYTDEADTAPWFEMADKDDPRLQEAVMVEVRKLFGSQIPDPVFLKAHPWTVGTTYWKPGAYDAHAMSVAAHCVSQHVYVVGEAISTRQAWIEGALESVDTLMERLPALARLKN